MTEQELYTRVILDGCSIEIGKLSLCCLNNYVRTLGETKFQVHCDHHKMVDDNGNPFTELYDKLEVAVDKFILLKNTLYKGQKNV